MSRVNIVVVGCGKWGKNHVRVFSELNALYAVYDIDKEKRHSFSGVHSFESFEAVLNTPAVDALVIATPVSSHFELTKLALLAGKDVLVEKPFVLTIDEGEELVELATKKNRVLMIGHLLLYHPAVVTLTNMVKAGDLGKINYIYSNRLNLGKLRTEENVFQSFAPHDISVILGLLEEEPSNIVSHEGTFLSKGVSDTTVTFMEFPSGVKAHIFVSWLHPYKEQKLVVVGTKAMAVFDDLTPEKLRVYPHKIKWEEGNIPVAEEMDSEIVPTLNTTYEPLKLECEHFLDCLRSGVRPKSDGQQALTVQRVLDRCCNQQKCSKVFVHESAIVDYDVLIGKGAKIWHFSHILGGTRIGENCTIGQNVMIGPNVDIGNNVKIQNNVSVYEGVTLEDDVFCGPSCVFTNVINPRSHISRKHEFKKTIVKRGATIGANATILCGVTIGEYAFVGAGAVVTKDLLPYELVYGLAAKTKGMVDATGTIIKMSK